MKIIMERREFFTRGGRLLLFTGMAAGTLFLGLSGKVSSSSDCRRYDLCDKCHKSVNCPENRKAKHHENGK